MVLVRLSDGAILDSSVTLLARNEYRQIGDVFSMNPILGVFYRLLLFYISKIYRHYYRKEKDQRGKWGEYLNKVRARFFHRSIYNLRWSKIHSNAKDGWMTNWDVHTIGGIAAGLKGWAGLNKTEAKHVIYCIIESIQDDTREWILQLLFFFFRQSC